MHWGDIAIHGAVALAIVATMGLAGLQWIAAGLVSTGFLLREEIQGLEKYAVWLTPWHWSVQKAMEGWVPVAVAIVVALLWRETLALWPRPKLRPVRFSDESLS